MEPATVAEFFQTGGVETSSRLTDIRWNLDRDFVFIVTELCMIALLLSNVWMIITEINDFLDELNESEAYGFARSFIRYLFSGFNLWDVLNILVFVVLLGTHVAVGMEGRRQLGGGLGNASFYPLDRLAYFTRLERDVISVYVLTSFGKVLKYLQIIPRIGPVLQAILSTIADRVIIAFMGFFLMFILVMSLSFHFAFGGELRGYFTLEQSWFSVMRVMFGEISYSYVQDTESYQGPQGLAGTSGLLLVVLLLVGNLVIMNITIAVISKVYENALQQHSLVRWEAMLTQLEAKDLWDNLPLDPSDNEFRGSHWIKRLISRIFGRYPRKPPVDALDDVSVNQWKRGRRTSETAQDVAPDSARPDGDNSSISPRPTDTTGAKYATQKPKAAEPSRSELQQQLQQLSAQVCCMGHDSSSL